MNSCVLRHLSIQMPNNAESICGKVGKKMRRLVLHAFIVHWGTTSARIAPPNTLTDSYFRFLPKAQPYQLFLTWTPKSKIYIFTLPKYTVLIPWCVVYTLFYYFAEVPPVFLHYWAKHHYNTELHPILTHCWGIPYLITWLSNSQFQ